MFSYSGDSSLYSIIKSGTSIDELFYRIANTHSRTVEFGFHLKDCALYKIGSFLCRESRERLLGGIYVVELAEDRVPRS